MKAIIPCLCLTALAASPIVAMADAAQPAHSITISLDKTATPVTDILKKVATQSGTRIFADSTVIDALGEGRISAANVEDALDSLAKLDPGLSWSKIGLPADTPLPAAEDLATAIRALRKIKADNLTISSGGSTLSVQNSVTPTAQPAADPHKVVVYLVTNEAEYQKRIDDKANAHYKKGNEAVETTMDSLHAIADSFDQMSPAQQSQIMPLIWSQLRYITRNLSPEVLNRFEHSYPQN